MYVNKIQFKKAYLITSCDLNKMNDTIFLEYENV